MATVMDSVRKRQVIIVLAVFVVVLCADQISKAFIVAKIPANSVRYKPHTLFWITHERNPGLVNGMFRDNPVIPFVAPLLATGVLLYLFRHLNPAKHFQTVAFGMVAGGALGNIADRLRLGSVTDFLQFHFYFLPFNFPWKYYPAFNIADSCICVGVVLLLVSWNAWTTTEKPDAVNAV